MDAIATDTLTMESPKEADLFAPYDRVALVLQGGGALGAYQAGVYQALHEAGCEPNWMSGVSIGAINAAIVAGNPRERRIERLREFWETVSGRTIWAYTPEGDYFRTMRNQLSAFTTMTLGQPGFFKPRPNAWLQPRGASGATSLYDTSELKTTLLRLVDFDRINDGERRLSVGAVNVRTGNFVYFDSRDTRIVPEHVMASGALPPALPAIKIDGEYYWDGGIVSNTPLQYLLDQPDSPATLALQVDLFSSLGELPHDMSDVLGRHKEIMYSSRTRLNTDNFQKLRAIKAKLLHALDRVPDEERTEADRELLNELTWMGAVNIVHLIYQQKHYEGNSQDYEFSGTSMREHWASGYEDTARTLRHRDWFAMPDQSACGVVVHDLHQDDPR